MKFIDKQDMAERACDQCDALLYVPKDIAKDQTNYLVCSACAIKTGDLKEISVH